MHYNTSGHSVWPSPVAYKQKNPNPASSRTGLLIMKILLFSLCANVICAAPGAWRERVAIQPGVMEGD